MLIKGVVAVVLIISGLFIYAALKSGRMSIAREQVVKAPVDKIFPFINSAQAADQWMPWQEIDPKVVMTYEGPSAGVGSTSKWTSDGQMGVGQAVVIESVENKLVKTKLNYVKPMNMEQVAELSLTPTSEGTLVRWSVTGENNFIGRFFCLFVDMEKMVGGNFETGLKKLKAVVEASTN